MIQRNLRNRLTGLVASAILGAGILTGNNLYADSGFLRMLGTSQKQMGHQFMGNTLDNWADNEDASIDEANAKKTQEKLDEIKKIEQERLRLERLNAQRNANRTYQNQQYRDIQTNKRSILEQELGNKVIFTANRWIDLNENNFPEHNEYQGVKNNFVEGEEMNIIVQNLRLPRVRMREVIYGPKGKLREWLYEGENGGVTTGFQKKDWEEIFRPMLLEGGAGSYKVAVYLNGELVATHDFEITKKNEEKK